MPTTHKYSDCELYFHVVNFFHFKIHQIKLSYYRNAIKIHFRKLLQNIPTNLLYSEIYQYFCVKKMLKCSFKMGNSIVIYSCKYPCYLDI